MIELLGLASGCLTTLAWLPQLRRTWSTRAANDISFAYLLCFGSGVVGWIAYGVLKGDVAVIAANAVTIALLSSLIVLKVSLPRAGDDRLGEQLSEQLSDAGGAIGGSARADVAA